MMEEQKTNIKESFFSRPLLFFGIYLMTAFGAVPYGWGSLNVYAMSYFHFRVNIETGSASSWILFVTTMAWGSGLLLGACISRRIGFRVTMVGAFIIFSTSMSLCYFAVQTSFVLLNVLVGGLCGFTFGLSQCLATILLTIWSTHERLGRAVCFLTVLQVIGNIVIAGILTKYVNPSNARPDTMRRNMKIFSQSKILDNIPFMFVIYGGIAFGAGAVASLLVWSYTPEGDTLNNKKIKEYEKNDVEQKKRDPMDRSYSSIKQTLSNPNVFAACHDGLDLDQRATPDKFEKGNQPSLDLEMNNESIVILEKLSHSKLFSEGRNHIRLAPGTKQTLSKSNVLASCGGGLGLDERATPDKSDNVLQMGSTILPECTGQSEFETRNEIPPLTPPMLKLIEIKNESNAILEKVSHSTLSEANHIQLSPQRKDTIFSERHNIIEEPAKTKEETKEDINPCANSSEMSDFSPKQVLKTKAFYIMVMMVANADVSCTILNTFYKLLGLVNYPDDEFFTRMGIWMNVGAVISLFLAGILSDKFGVENTVIGNTVLLSFVSAMFYFSSLISKWLYLVLGVIFNGCALAVYILIPLCASKYFGKEVMTTVYGMALMPMYVTNIGMPFITDYILSHFGWLHLFTLVGIFNLVALIVIVWGFNNSNHLKQRRN